MKRAVQKDRDARWTVEDSKAKPAPDGAKRVDIANTDVRLQEP